MQVCLLSRYSESTHFLSLRRGVAILESTRAAEDFWERRHVPLFDFLIIPNRKRQPYRTKTGQIITIQNVTYFSTPDLNNEGWRG